MQAAVVIRELQRQRMLQINNEKAIVPAAPDSLLVGRFVLGNKCNLAFSRTMRWDAINPTFVGTPRYIAAMREFEAPLIPMMHEGSAPAKLVPGSDSASGWRNVGSGTQEQHEIDVVKPANARIFNIAEICTMNGVAGPGDDTPLSNVSCSSRDARVVGVIIDGVDNDTLAARFRASGDDGGSSGGGCPVAKLNGCQKNLALRSSDGGKDGTIFAVNKYDANDVTSSPPSESSTMSSETVRRVGLDMSLDSTKLDEAASKLGGPGNAYEESPFTGDGVRPKDGMKQLIDAAAKPAKPANSPTKEYPAEE